MSVTFISMIYKRQRVGSLRRVAAMKEQVTSPSLAKAFTIHHDINNIKLVPRGPTRTKSRVSLDSIPLNP